MADFKTQMDEWKVQLNRWLEQAKTYFQQLTDLEMYGWIGEGVGFLMVIAGILLFFV